MTKKLDDQTERVVRADARALESEAEATEAYPADTQITRPNRPSRMFNVRLTDAQFNGLRGGSRAPPAHVDHGALMAT